MYVGSTERNLHELFETARAHGPCVLFLDEIDALGHKRTLSRSSGDSATSVNQLLTELDGVGSEQRGRVRARRHQPPVGRRPGAAPAGPPRPDAARAAARPGGPRGDLPHTTCATGRSRASTSSSWPSAPTGFSRRRHRPRVRHRRRVGDAGLGRAPAYPDDLDGGLRRRTAARSAPPSAPGWRPPATSRCSPTRAVSTTSWPRTSASAGGDDRSRGEAHLEPDRTWALVGGGSSCPGASGPPPRVRLDVPGARTCPAQPGAP